MSKELIQKVEATLHYNAQRNWEDNCRSIRLKIRQVFKWNGTSSPENILEKEIDAALQNYKETFLNAEYARLEKKFFSELSEFKTLIATVTSLAEVEEELSDE